MEELEKCQILWYGRVKRRREEMKLNPKERTAEINKSERRRAVNRKDE